MDWKNDLLRGGRKWRREHSNKDGVRRMLGYPSIFLASLRPFIPSIPSAQLRPEPDSFSLTDAMVNGPAGVGVGLYDRIVYISRGL